MALRKILVGILVMVMVSPAWGVGEPMGSVTSSINATVRETKLTPGSTVFMDDIISVGAHGGARIALKSGAQAEILGPSSVRLTMADNRIQMVVDRGHASFVTTGGSEISALVGDTTVRPAANVETSAILQSLSETHAIIAAQKGALLLTMNDGRVLTVPEGEAADLTASIAATPDLQQGGGAIPAGKSAPPISIRSKKKALIWVAVIGGAGVGVTACLLLRNETKLTTTQIGNEISPDKPN
jgi:hypothetical protein